MTKTIDELAEEYCKSTLVGPKYIKTNAYKAGANAVLEEIENVLNKEDFQETTDLYSALCNKVKQLKGE